MTTPGPWPGRAFPYVVGESKRMQDVYAMTTSLVGGDANVCLQGGRGTGKELIAVTLHAAGPRRHRPYVAFDCTAVDARALDGRLAAGRGAGTLFLDDIGALASPLQARLLECTTSGMDLRVIAGSAPEAPMPPELQHRLAAVHVELPPLRERTEDIPLLTAHFLRVKSARYGKRIRDVTPGTLDRLVAHAWPGNVRELESVIERAVVMADTDVVDVERLPSFGDDGAPPPAPKPPRLSLREVERLYILETLEETRWNRAKAARLLGISVRGLQYKLQRYLGDAKSIGGARAG
jgi:DNA-binding NtrC family response regulator